MTKFNFTKQDLIDSLALVFVLGLVFTYFYTLDL